MDNLLIRDGYCTLLVDSYPDGVDTVRVSDGEHAHAVYLTTAQMNQLTDYLIELRGQRRIQALLEQA